MPTSLTSATRRVLSCIASSALHSPYGYAFGPLPWLPPGPFPPTRRQPERTQRPNAS
jgi:hypothetical protein